MLPAILTAMLNLSATDTQCEAFHAFLASPSPIALSDWQATITEE